MDCPMPIVRGRSTLGSPSTEGAGRQPLQYVGFGGLTRRHDGGVGEPLGIMEGALADAEVVDRDEDPPSLRVPVGLRAVRRPR